MGEEFIRRIMVLGEVPLLGPVILFDDIEGLFKWSKTGTGADYVVEKDAAVAYNGSACLHLKTRVTGAAENDFAQAARYHFQRPGKRYRLECIFQIKVRADCKYVFFCGEIYDGSVGHFCGIRYDSQNGKWQYRTGLTAYTDVPGGSQNLIEGRWHRFLVEYDEHKKEFVRLIADSLEVPLAGKSYYSAASATAIHQTTWVEVVAQSTTPPEVYVDDVLVMEV